MLNLKSFKFSDIKKLKRYASPSALEDLNGFLERLPQNAGKGVLIAAGIAWAATGALGIFTTLKAQDLNNLRAQLQDAQALQPIVPQITEVPVDTESVTALTKKMADVYKNMEISSSGGGMTIKAPQTGYYSLFREAVAQVQNGGPGWKVSLDSLCVGRECKQKPLSISLKINKINIDKPTAPPISYLPSAIKPSQGGEK
jgi:hypothetical protein